MWYIALYAGLLLATASFVWFYNQPLASDIPMHIALAKAYADYLAGTGGIDSTYQPYLTLSSYALPELMLVPLILLFGVDLAWKIALSLYGLVFPLTVSHLVSKVNPASRWARLVGFPITLGYFFHWGFWPYLVGFAASVVATAVSLGERRSAMPMPKEVLARLFTFLCHPVPAFCVGIFDIVRLFGGFPLSSEQPVPPWRKAFGYLVLLWLPSLLIVLFMLSNDLSDGRFRWTDLSSQIVQLLRPFYLTRQWYEFAIPLVFAALLTYRVLVSTDLRSRRGFLLIAGLVCIVVGLLVPRGQFIGSWENGARVVLYGFILISASWAWIERESKALILAWVISGSAINLMGSHSLWSTHEPSFAWAMDMLDKRFRGYRVVERGTWSGAFGIALGNNLPVWAWCKGIAADAKNLAGVRKTGPAFYQGLNPEQRASVKTVVLYYHPYRRESRLWENHPDQPVYFDSSEIYSIQERVWSNTVSEKSASP
jgi:hypothetical protein